MAELQHWEQDKSLYLFTSLTAGSSHIVTATSRIETILRNARIPFTYIDTATNESAKKLFQRRARGKKLPLLVKEGFVIGDLDEVEEWNEFGELEEVIGEVSTTETSIASAPAKMTVKHEGDPPKQAASTAIPTTTSAAPETKKENVSQQQPNIMAQLAQEASAKAKQNAKKIPTPTLTSKTNATDSTTSKEPPKEESKDAAKEADKASEKETPLSPSKVELPMSPSVKSPTGSVSHRRHSSTGSAHSFVPEKSEPPTKEHRGSLIGSVSEEEIKKIESETSIAEEDEDEEAVKITSDALPRVAEGKDTDKLGPPLKKDPVLTPVEEEEKSIADNAETKPTPLKQEEKAEDEDDEDAELFSDSAPEEAKPPVDKAPSQPVAAKPDQTSTPAKKKEKEQSLDNDEVVDAILFGDGDDEEDDKRKEGKTESAPAVSTSGTTKVDSTTKLVEEVDKIKIKDQDPVDPNQATVSNED